MHIDSRAGPVPLETTADRLHLVGTCRTMLLAFSRTLRIWHRRARSRAGLRQLEPHLLKDVGISISQRNREVRKRFWMR